MRVISKGQLKMPIVITYPQAVCCREVTTTNMVCVTSNEFRCSTSLSGMIREGASRPIGLGIRGSLAPVLESFQGRQKWAGIGIVPPVGEEPR
jgi:hypothetical protein